VKYSIQCATIREKEEEEEEKKTESENGIELTT